MAATMPGMASGSSYPGRFELIDTRLWTQLSSNIRSNFGFLSRLSQEDPYNFSMEGQLIKQVGSKVFKEVTVAGHQFIVDFLAEYGHTPGTMRRFWLHQANARMMGTVAHQIGVKSQSLRTTIAEFGNSSAATIPLTLSISAREYAYSRGDIVLMTAAGAGLTGGAAVIRW